MATTATESETKRLTQKLSLKAKLGYGTIGFSYISQTMLLSWQMFFFTTFVGMDVAAAGTIVALGRIVAAFIAPVWGYISDRLYHTRIGKKLGRRRGTLLLTMPGIFLFYTLQWFPGMPTVCYGLWNLLYWACFAGLTTVQYGLPSEMTDNPSQRAQLVGINQIASAVSNILLATINTYLFTVWGSKTWEPYMYMALIYGVISTVVLVIGLFTIKERPYDDTTDVAAADSERGEKVPFTKRVILVVWNYISALRVKEYRNYLGMYLSQNMFRGVRGAIMSYFLIFTLRLDPAAVSVSQGFGFAFGIALVGFFIWLNSKIGGTKAFRVGSIEAIFVFLAMFVLAQLRLAGQIGTPETVAAWVVLTLCLNFGITGVVNATDYAYSFIPDVDEVLTAKRREGQYASINSTIDDIFTSLEAIVITSVLGAAGFVSGAPEQTPQVAQYLMYLFSFVPIAFCILGLVFSFRVKLNDQTHTVLVAEIDRLRKGGSKADVDPETKQLVEDLTGFPYEKCWGNNNVINVTQKAMLEQEEQAAAANA